MLERKTVKKNLTDMLDGLAPKLFPFNGQVNYATRFKTIAEYLNLNVHNETEKGALFASIKDGKIPPQQVVYLNNHGPGHVEHVVKCASDLLRTFKCTLEPYEVYLLLVAIHFHDAGNVFGREEHEKRCKDIMTVFGEATFPDAPEKKNIVEIASAHGGNVDGNPDTISLLKETDSLLGKHIRPQFLAAILRFADELSDDKTRASRFMLDNDLLPEHSKIHHLYSSRLHSVIVNHEEIELSFVLKKEDVLGKYSKGDQEVYLLDEIFERTLKMHCEALYCMRFLRPEVQIKKVCVNIEIYVDFNHHLLQQLEKFTYTLQDKGYPAIPDGGIHELCPELENLTGEKLQKKLLD